MYPGLDQREACPDVHSSAIGLLWAIECISYVVSSPFQSLLERGSTLYNAFLKGGVSCNAILLPTGCCSGPGAEHEAASSPGLEPAAAGCGGGAGPAGCCRQALYRNPALPGTPQLFQGQ